MKRIAFYGGSFDPIHNGHLAIARNLLALFAFDEFYFVPAFHAPHKQRKTVTSPLCRYAMLTLATQNEPRLKISTIELEAPEKPFTFETLTKLKNYYAGSAEIFFVMGADSWNEINTWRDWENLLTLTNFVVVTRPNFEITTTQVTAAIAARVIDIRGKSAAEIAPHYQTNGIFISDAVMLNISATNIRREIASPNNREWHKLVTAPVAGYIEKYQLYI